MESVRMRETSVVKEGWLIGVEKKSIASVKKDIRSKLNIWKGEER
jgi:hypothetical protein